MNKKIISFSLIIALIMFMGINVKADSCTQGYTDYYCPTSCVAEDEDGKTKCTCTKVHDKNGCASGSPSDCESDSNNTCSCPAADGSIEGTCSGTISAPATGHRVSCGNHVKGASGHPTGLKCDSTSPYAGTAPGADTAINVTRSPEGASCKVPVTVECTWTNNCGGDEASDTLTFYIETPWSSTGKKVPDGNYQGQGVYWAQQNNKGYYYSYEGGSWVRYSRGTKCGGGPDYPEPGCFKDKETGFLYWDYEAQDANLNKNPITQTTYQIKQKYAEDAEHIALDWYVKSGYTKTDIIDPKQCVTQFGCSLPTNPNNRNVETTCNSIGNISTKDNGSEHYNIHCGVKADGKIDSKIYSIDCDETMKTAFNGPVWDNKHSFMYPGTGFGFNYQAKTKVECEGEWHEKFFQDARKYEIEYLQKHSDYSGSIDMKNLEKLDTAEYYWQQSATSKMDSIKSSYQNWSLKKIYFSTNKTAATGTIADDQSNVSRSAGREKDEYKEDLEIETPYNSTQPTSECYTKTSSGAPTQSVPDNFVYKVSYTFNFKLPLLYYTADRKYSTEACANCGQLGRIFPISDNDDYVGKSQYNYKVEINNLGMYHTWKNHETCSIGDGMKEKKIVFRQVNLSDPFIQKLATSDHKIGNNWKNDKYDFTKVIDPNIWSKTSQYNTVTINQEAGKLIKAELSRNTNSYLGSCSKKTATGATPTICSLYSQAKK